MSKYLAQNLQSKQKDWNEATQKRLAMTTSMLSSMKGLKMLGVTNYAAGLVQHLRKQELEMASRVRWMMVAYNASANALGLFAPIITLMVFVIVASINRKGQYLDTETAFTTTALLGLVTHPANMIMTIIPQAVGSLAGFQRIQDYLLQPPRGDSRVLLRESDDAMTGPAPAIVIERVAIQPNASKPPIVSNINLEVARGSLAMCSGPVGCGKSALAKALIGELPVNSGTISLSSKRIGYCAQSPWLPGGTFKEAICGFLPVDQSWYEEVLQLCCLKEDLEGLSKGDQTMIGSRGLNLSGGQRQRVALARALYARCDIMLLDDSFSALDGKTERQIVDNLIGSEGYFKKAGVAAFIITNSTSYFKLADQLLILGNGSVAYKGTWDDLAQKPGEILKFNHDESHDQSSVQEVKMDKTVLKQKLKVEEGISDLSRAAGDFSLYEIFKLIVQTALLFTAQKMMTLAFPLVVVAIYVVQRVYLRTSRQLRLLDLESQSAVYSSFLESLDGLATIRAFGWEKQVENANIRSLDKSQQPAYILFCLQQVSLGAISRLKNLEEETPKEDKRGEDYVPKLPWPSAGVVEINDMTVAYNSEAVALQNVTIKVSGGQQLVICGRTGSGKSTLLLALLRLLDPISMVGWRGLADVLIIDVLQRTGLWSHFKSGESEITPSEAKDILDTSMSSLPQMSTGQTQLFSLSRAILQKSIDAAEASVLSGQLLGKKILLLDEATASLDPDTETAMSRIIHEEFTAKGHTVIAISHRLGGLAENMREGQDAVALLSNGRIDKIGSVHEVLGTTALDS
ncbi:ABC transporter atnG [Colletotrichum sp. SAR 10_70]|nr:ABC transporter atnG [Colletotrichum sp. SAR 10_71]KAI8171131.1 ABC transporter atnG [Colletotrichum sp. SAR 10_65]KAI8177988.1 ABC transporter atnG [Colletotrichum sp. SAR 10_75]KAI8204299.1 ABC transporter atnG [Colletotrichum sp. SAR 10_70]KAI8224285.1 ABC transporter atnG [Colletotrichum sp. SAR 10_86]KAI8263736.1 ABC transporter atnG [Colletotrichum sp. SAR 10_77]